MPWALNHVAVANIKKFLGSLGNSPASIFGTIERLAHCPLPRPEKENAMDREHVKGFAEKAKGAVKEGAGKMMDDKSLETEGRADKAKGDVHNAAGNIKDAGRNAADALKK
jgi:uncharacterized protein YjbJ (UPF0337 family)